jgi:hypothetical protein
MGKVAKIAKVEGMVTLATLALLTLHSESLLAPAGTTASVKIRRQSVLTIDSFIGVVTMTDVGRGLLRPTRL